MAKTVKDPNLKAVRRLTAYQKVFAGPEGEKVLSDLMATHFVLGSTFDKDPNMHAFKEGQRNVVLRILTMLNTDVKELRERIKLHEQNIEF